MQKSVSDDALFALAVALGLTWFLFGTAVRDYDPSHWGSNGLIIVFSLVAIGFVPSFIIRRRHRRVSPPANSIFVDALIALMFALTLSGMIMRSSDPSDPGSKGLIIAAGLFPWCFFATFAGRKGWQSMEKSGVADAYKVFRITFVAVWFLVGSAQRDFNPAHWGSRALAIAVILLVIGFVPGFLARRWRRAETRV